MIIRFLSLLLISSASIIWGMQKGDTLLSEICNQEGMLTFITAIKRGIICYRTPVYDILQDIPDGIFNNVDILRYMRANGIEAGYSAYKTYFGYDAFTDRRVTDFFNRLGSLTVTEQILMCEELSDLLTSAFEKKRNNYPRQRKLYLTLGVTFGLGIVILFI